MVIHVFVKAELDGIAGGFWNFEVRYFRVHGNTQGDILNMNSGFVQITSLYQLYLKATHEAMLYLNTLIGTRKPDTREITIHIPCVSCIRWLEEEKERMLSTKARAKVERGYIQFVNAINVETNQWKVKYELTDEG